MAGHRNKVSWSSGLCGCFDDLGGCCLTLFCPCITFGRIAEIVDKGAISCCASGTMHVLQGLGTSAIGSILYHCCDRARLRAEHGLEEKPCADCCTPSAGIVPSARSIASSRVAALTCRRDGMPTWRGWGRLSRPR
ncbi:hypothetical protein CFC21_027129 [Triticum aestivum]|uniref:Uncharacterized protein n=3 Tax=Triticinae TaxID=1648030 RepID=A0A452XD08_AEGTS|nr:hypothetical protein CFC21_027129 [Triticum aestivum]